MVSTRIVCREFVGRARELDHLMLRRRQAGDGHGGLVLIGGEPGIGKSRLVGEFKERLNRRTSLVSSSACREFAQKPLEPLFDILRQLAQTRAGDLPSSSQSERLQAIADTLQRVAAKRTCVAIIEDLHWADVDLIQTLSVLVQRAAGERLLFVATYRDNEITAEHPLFTWFGRLLREPAASHVLLGRFKDRELSRLIASAIEGAAELAPAALHAVRDRSDGNPLFAEELLRSAVDASGAGAHEPSRALPWSLHALVAERLQSCSADARSFLQHASLFGRHFYLTQVCEIFGGDESALKPVAQTLCELQLLDAVNAKQGAYRFRHALTRDAVYGEMAPEAVRPLHLKIAAHLERSADPRDVAELLAYHLWEGGEKERAATYYELAGDAALRTFAYAEASECYRRAADGLSQDRAACARLYGRAAQAQIFSGDLDGGLDLYERSSDLGLQLGDVAQVVRNRALMAGHLFDGGRRDAAIALLRETLAVAERGDMALQARLRTRLAMTLARDSRLEEAWHALAQIDASTLDSQAEWTGEYHLCASELHALRSETDLWKTSFASGVAIYESLGHPGPLHVAHANFAVQALSLGEMALARKHHSIAGAFARTLHFDDQAVLQAQVEFFCGNLKDARRIVTEMAPSQRFLIRAMLAQVAVPVAIALGDNRMLEEYLDERLIAQAAGETFTATMTRVAAAHALGLAALNRRGEARLLATRVLQSVETAFGMALPVVAVAMLIPERAAALRPVLTAAAKPEGDRTAKALLAFLEAALATAGGDDHGANAFASDAARRFAEIGWPLFQAHALELAGERQGALAIYRRCGAAGDMRRLEFEAPARSAAEATSLGTLTRRERELAMHVASGKSNRAIAAALSVGEKTVEKYLTSIYAKLGLNSRAQLAALVAASTTSSERYRSP